MTITLYAGFQKKENSTKQPTENTPHSDKTGTLKNNTDMLNPVIVFERFSGDAVPFAYTYALIPAFSRFYFVTGWRWAEGVWECSMKVDVLASCKTQIGLQTEYVLRTDSSTTNFDPLITDTLYPANNDFESSQVVIQNSNFVSGISQGIYIVGIISGDGTNDGNPVGAITYYAMTASEFATLKSTLLSDSNLTAMDLITGGEWNSDDMSKEIFKTMYNPFQYIASCMWLPITKSNIAGSTQSGIKIGWWTYSGVAGSKVYAQTVSFNNSEQTTVPAHPQAATRGTYLNYAPYTKIQIYGRFGSFPVDTSYLKAGYKLNIGYTLDIITGQCRSWLSTWDPSLQSPTVTMLAERNFMLGVPIQLAQVGVDYLGTAVSAIDTVANTVSAASRFDVGGAISAGAHGIYNTLQSSMPQMATSGSNGSFLAPFTNTTVVYHFYKIVDEDIAHKGRPLCKLKQLNTLTGYILCAEGEFDISCFDSERMLIKNFLTTGFFWE